MLSESTSTTSRKKYSKVSFSHKTVQEFFAAIFISFHIDAQKIVLEKCRNIQDILGMSKMYEFIIEMNSDRMCAISNDLMSVINDVKGVRDYRNGVKEIRDYGTWRDCDNMYFNTRDYRIKMYNDFIYIQLFYIQKMFVSILQKMPESEKIHLYLQDFFIENQTVHSKQLQCLLKENKTNIKSLHLNIYDTSSSLREIIDLFSLTDFSHIQKLYFTGDSWKESEINRIMFPSLQCVTLFRGTWTNDEENLSENLARLQNLQYLYIEWFTLSHKLLETFYNFISGQKSIKELTLSGLYCKEHGGHDCKRLMNLDLSPYSTLSKLYFQELPGRLQLNISTPSLVNVMLCDINLDKSSLILSRDMLNIERVKLKGIKMSALRLQNFITVLENLPQSVTVAMTDIKRRTEYDRVRKNVRRSQTFHVIHDVDYMREIVFKTIKPSKE
ncbi:uncharacterized protein LOC132760616 [Ruditapes philippinarum]|uniref:uncharacterized protein LOC132760616 n=1 Tax=Ruditapes philippinarum TaxID=129788 RepID=UPI00295AC61F|nr:uncharacterized protein LOC132760616 [Ruditapes philippinarum]